MHDIPWNKWKTRIIYKIYFLWLKGDNVCYYHVTYLFQSEFTLHSCLNVKELLAWNRRGIWSLSDSNGIRAHNHLVRKRTVNHLARLVWLNGWVFVYKLSGCGFEPRCYHLREYCEQLKMVDKFTITTIN